MRVEVDHARVVGPSNQHGEQYVTTNPASSPTYRGGTELLGDHETPARRLKVVALDVSKLGLDVGGLGCQVVHVNAEYHDQVSDHDPQVVDIIPLPRGRMGGWR